MHYNNHSYICMKVSIDTIPVDVNNGEGVE